MIDAAATAGLLDERHQTHGDFHENALYSQALRQLWRSSPKWPQIHPAQQEALDMIATKLSRVLSGQADYGDHWDDVIGYATLARRVCRK